MVSGEVVLVTMERSHSGHCGGDMCGSGHPNGSYEFRKRFLYSSYLSRFGPSVPHVVLKGPKLIESGSYIVPP